MVVNTRSQMGGQREEEVQGSSQGAHDGTGAHEGARTHGGAGASATANPTVPLSEYEALKHENDENRRMIKEIMAMFKEILPQMSLPSGLQGFARSENPNAREKAPLESHHQDPLSRIQEEPELRVHPEPRTSEERHNPPKEEGKADFQRGKEKFQEVVESTCRGNHKASTKRMEQDNQSMLTAKDVVDMKRIVEEVLEQKKLVPTEETQRGGQNPFTKEIMEKSLPKKFNMPPLPSYTGKEDPHEHI